MNAVLHTPWAVATAALLATTLLVDAMLGKRYAGGSAERDQKTAPLLVIVLSINLVAQLAFPAFGVGLYAADTMRIVGPLGLVLAALGLAMRYSAIFALGRRFTWQVSIVEQHELNCDGIFGWVRHPSYAGGLLALVGSALSFGSWPPLLLVLATHFPTTMYRISVEERVLAEHFGDLYRRYAERTARLLPFVY